MRKILTALTLVLLLLSAIACLRGTTTRVEAAWRTYLDATYGDPNYVGAITPADIEQLGRTARLYGPRKAADKGLVWSSLTPRQQRVWCSDVAMEAAFTQRFGSPQAGREYHAPGTWQTASDPLSIEWAATMVAIKVEVEKTCR